MKLRYLQHSVRTLLAICLCVGSSTFAGAQESPPVRIPAATFASPPAMDQLQLSPDGTRFAGKVLVGGKQRFVVVTLTGSGGIASFGQDDVDVNWWRWVNDNWLVVGLGTTKLWYGQDLYLTRLAGFSADLKTINAIDWEHSGQNADDLLWVARDGSTRIRFSKMTGFDKVEDWEPSVYEADVATAKVKLLIGARDDIYRWRADGNGQIRFAQAYRPMTKTWTAFYRDDDRSTFVRMADSDDPLKGIPTPLVFGPDKTAFAIGSVNGFDQLYEMALPGFKPGKTLHAVPGYDVDSVYLNDSRDGPLGVSFYGASERQAWFDPQLIELQRDFDKALGAGNASIVSWSRDRRKYVVRVGAAAQAGGMYFYDTAVGSLKLLGWANPALRNTSLSPVSTIRYKARDGTPIEAVLTLPRGRAATRLPLIVLPHGGPHVRDWENFDWWAQYLAEQGYAVIQPNYRGSTGYGHAFEKLGDGQWGLKMQDDLIDAIGWASAQGIADSKRVCIAGASYGGYAAMRGAQRDGDSYRCAISYAGVSDLAAMMKYDRKFLLGDFSKGYWKDQSSDFAAVSPRLHAADFRVPMLIMHGTRDKRVPVKQSRAMADELQRAGKTVDYVEQPLGDHHFSRTEDRLQFLEKTKAFLDRYNPS